jgi:hypothetical protein
MIKLKPNQREGLFESTGALATFSSKIRIGYALDIFGPETYQNLDYIRHVRNAFAHTKISVSFETAAIKNICELLIMPRSVGQVPHIFLKDRPHPRGSGSY